MLEHLLKRVEMADLRRRHEQIDRLGFFGKRQLRHLPFNHLPRPRKRQRVGQPEKVRRKAFDKIPNRALRLLAPFMKRLLRLAERGIKVADAQRFGESARIVARHQLELVANVHERVIDRRGGEHQHAHVVVGFQERLDQIFIAARFGVAEVVAFVNHNQFPLVALKIVSNPQSVFIAFQTGFLQIRMKADRIIELVILKARIMLDKVLTPILLQFFRAEQNHFIAFCLEKFHDRQRRPRFAQADGIRENRAAMFLQHTNQAHRAFLLELVERVVNRRVFEFAELPVEIRVGNIRQNLLAK